MENYAGKVDGVDMYNRLSFDRLFLTKGVPNDMKSLLSCNVMVSTPSSGGAKIAHDYNWEIKDVGDDKGYMLFTKTTHKNATIIAYVTISTTLDRGVSAQEEDDEVIHDNSDPFVPHPEEVEEP